ncbi:hypothetical protein [Paenibacillus paeoniae]|uniref:DUF4878 domain-containing protein n=1 Tax=Paenibacillus paeoniae TaxID=2292705 RepID=A0A371PLE2_9BACL|nr:hypothetical protein [Paenibacillus paeoniae]REK77022.1 hypothetical protein DX130_08430 [Paenibacillus paeoniae]
MIRKILIAGVVLIGIYTFFCMSGTRGINLTLNSFYDGFAKNKLETSYLHFTIKNDDAYDETTKMGSIAQSIINDRHWYGEIDRHKKMGQLWIGPNKKLVFIKVESNNTVGKWFKGIDRLTMVKADNEWLIKQYRSGSPWPTMP